MRFVYVPAGKFWMGGGGGKRSDKEVIIEEPFYVGVYEVTQGEWQAVMGDNPSHFSRTGKGKGAVQAITDEQLKRFPVEQVSFDDVQEFLKRFNEREKASRLTYRLPTDEEWEYACRGGPTSGELYGVNDPYSYHFYLDVPSNDLSSYQANFDGNHPYGSGKKGPNLARPCEVGSYKANCLGISDLHGNVMEWTSSLFDNEGAHRVYRGGNWDYDGEYCRAAYRRSGEPSSYRRSRLGFRLARSSVGAQE